MPEIVRSSAEGADHAPQDELYNGRAIGFAAIDRIAHFTEGPGSVLTAAYDRVARVIAWPMDKLLDRIGEAATEAAKNLGGDE